MTQTEALKMALEALEECRRDPRLKYEHPTYDKAITAIKEALAQPEQRSNEHLEPVAWATRMGEYAHIKWGAKRLEYPMVYEIPLYTTPPHRTWVGLTDEEKLHIEIMGGKADVMLAEMVEAKLREKNT